MKMVALSDLVGQDVPMRPAELLFTTRASLICHGCIFRGQRSSICYEAARVALRAGLDDCDDGVVYVAVETDPRQLPIV